MGASLSGSSGCVTDVTMAVSGAIGVWGKHAATKGSRMPLRAEPSPLSLQAQPCVTWLPRKLKQEGQFEFKVSLSYRVS